MYAEDQFFSFLREFRGKCPLPSREVRLRLRILWFTPRKDKLIAMANLWTFHNEHGRYLAVSEDFRADPSSDLTSRLGASYFEDLSDHYQRSVMFCWFNEQWERFLPTTRVKLKLMGIHPPWV